MNDLMSSSSYIEYQQHIISIVMTLLMTSSSPYQQHPSSVVQYERVPHLMPCYYDSSFPLLLLGNDDDIFPYN